jgi:hypothetical protein
VPGGGDGQGGPGRQLYYRSDVCRVPGRRVVSCESDILPNASSQCLGFKIQAFCCIRTQALCWIRIQALWLILYSDSSGFMLIPDPGLC